MNKLFLLLFILIGSCTNYQHEPKLDNEFRKYVYYSKKEIIPNVNNHEYDYIPHNKNSIVENVGRLHDSDGSVCVASVVNKTTLISVGHFAQNKYNLFFVFRNNRYIIKKIIRCIPFDVAIIKLYKPIREKIKKIPILPIRYKAELLKNNDNYCVLPSYNGRTVVIPYKILVFNENEIIFRGNFYPEGILSQFVSISGYSGSPLITNIKGKEYLFGIIASTGSRRKGFKKETRMSMSVGLEVLNKLKEKYKKELE